ncbi:protein kinase [Planotetraspora thailandica]|nr:serine/threonine-protein kinase [Planotetraspora thailandica]
MSATEAPERIGPYRLLRPLGEGGMGVVYLGVDGDGREVAVKVLHPHVATDLKARDRLTREVETMRRVRSRRVAEVLDADLTGASPYIVTRYAPGRTLEQTVVADGPLPDHEVVRLARGLCEALVAIHAADVVHRDLKPANVMIVEGEPLVIDFGIAHLVNATRLTQTGMFVGTPGYLAPEIIRDSEITQAADVHALAATVFFAATGKQPFGSGTFEAVCYRILEGKAQIDEAPMWMRAWLRLTLATESGARPSAASLLRITRALDPRVTALREMPQDGTRVLGPPADATDPDATRVVSDGTRLLNDGTMVLNDGTRILTDGTKVLTDGTRVLNDGTKVLGDGTRVLDDAARGGLAGSGGGRPGDRAYQDSYSDLLPPVNYVKPERVRRESPRANPPVVPPPAAPGYGQERPAAYAPPPAYQPPPQPPAYRPEGYPPPQPDQRVAGYPEPRAATAPPQLTSTQPGQAAPRPAEQDRPAYRTGHPVISALLLVSLVALTCLLPVWVSLFSIGLTVCLRVVHYLVGGLSERRSVRGSSGADPILTVLGIPWALIKAALATLVQVPLSLIAGLCVWGGLYYWGSFTRDQAAAYAAAAFVAGLFLLPGGGSPRKAVSRTLTSAIRSPGAAMVITIAVGALAFFAVLTAMTAGPSWEPWRPPSQAIADLTRQGQETIGNLVGGLFGDLLDRIGLGFLTFWN